MEPTLELRCLQRATFVQPSADAVEDFWFRHRGTAVYYGNFEDRGEPPATLIRQNQFQRNSLAKHILFGNSPRKTESQKLPSDACARCNLTTQAVI